MKKDFLNGVYNFISNYRNTALICVTIILAFNIKAFTLPVPQNIVSDNEPNNSPLQASSLSPNSTILCSIGEGSDYEDWYKITLPSEGELKVWAEVENDMDVSIDFFDKSGIWWIGDRFFVGGTGITDSTKRSDMMAGEYFIKVWRESGSGNYTLKNKYTPTSIPNGNDIEPNNESAQAISFQPNIPLTGHIGYVTNERVTDNVDWYKITLPNDGELKVWADIDKSLDIAIDFYDKSGIWWIGDRFYVGGLGAPDSTKRSDLMAGEYFIKVWRESGQGSYTLKNKFTPASIPNGNDNEPNNESVQALNLQPNTSLTGHIGYMSNDRAYDNVDWYKITLPNDGELKVWADIEKSLDIAIEFYDKSGIWWIGDRFYVGGLGATDSTKRSDLMAGEYFIKVWRESGQGSYTLKNKFTPTSIPNGNDSELNDEAVKALNMQPNISLTGHIGYMSNDRASDNVDWYKVTLPNDGELKVWADIDKSLDIAIEFFDKSSIWWIGNRFFVGGTGVTDSTKRSDLMAGEYYIKLWRESGHGSYTLKNKFIPASIPDGNDQEPNNEATLATSMQMDITRTGHIGYVSDERAQDYYDWFVFNVPENMDLEIITKPDNTLDINEELYNQQMNFISSCFHCGGMGETDSLKKENLQSGTYYLKISTSSGYGSYEIIAKKHIKTNVSNSHLSKADFYPNPCNGKLNIKTKAEDIDELKIYDSTGRLFARLEKIKANSFIEILIPYKGLFYCISSVKGKTEVIKIMVL